jgi:Serine hydrolase (FSH1)
MRDLRILCLHGYHGSAAVLQRQMAPLAAAVPSNVELVYVDAPSLARNDFGWWHSPSRGWDRTRQWAVDLFTTQPHFDGVLGFSQGAALTGLLAGLQENLLRQTDPGDPAAAIRFDFAVMIGGFKNDAPRHAELYRHTFALPSVHVIGRTDGIIPARESLDLAHQFENPVVLEHPGGHVIPNDRAVVDGVVRFLDQMSGEPAPVHSTDGSPGAR